MKKTLALVLCLAVCLLGLVPVTADQAAAPEAYLMYADASWTNQYWGGEAPEGVTAINAPVDGAGEYTVGLSFAQEAQGLAFAAVGITDGETKLPGYTIEIKAIRVNGEEISFEKGYTSSDDGITTRMNLYNEWVSALPDDARSFDGKTDDAKPMIVDTKAFEAVKSVEVDFALHQYGVDTAYIMYADSSWTNQYWGGEAPEGVTATNAVIDGFGDYSVALSFDKEAEGLAFSALGIVNGEKTYPGAYLKINELRVNGEAVELAKGYTSSDDGITTRMNLYNEWVSEVPADGRSFDGTLEGASPIIVDKEAFAAVKTVEIDFSLLPVTDTAYLMYADSSWTNQYWGGEAPEGVTATNAEITGAGVYTVGLAFDQEAQGLAFSAVGIVSGEKTFNGYFINVTEVKVNGEAIELGKGYTSSDDGVTTRENLYNEWVSEVPADARRADGDMEGASAIIVDQNAFDAVKTVEVTFEFIYGKPIAGGDDAPMTQEEADALKQNGFHAYIGVQGKDTYVFRNAWNDNYGLNDEVHPYFYRLTGWNNPDTEDGSDDLGGTFEDALINGNGEYTVSLTTGERGFGATSEFNLLFVSTDIPSKLIADGYLTVENVKIKIGSAATQEYTNVNIDEGEYARIDVINVYGTGADFGYTVPGAGETITITFTVSGW